MKNTVSCLSVIVMSLLLTGSTTSGEAKLSVDELVAKHLESIGTPEARAAVKSRAAQGAVAFNERISGSVHLDGTALLLSKGPMLKCAFQFNSPQYRGEQFVFDGKAVQVALIDQQSRSALGNFLVSEPEILEEGLWGGTLSMGWPLLDVKAMKAKLKSEGLRKIEGQGLYEVTYISQKGSRNGELSIHFYFEPNTLHHVMTIYRLSATTDTASEGEAQASGSGTRTTTVTELFSDFHDVDGVTLPEQWEMRLRVEPGKAQEFQWKAAFSAVAHNRF